jgi:hypothetical protein
MAESIYTQLENQNILTPVNGIDIRHDLPAGLFPDAETFESPENLIAWADENDYTAKLIQKGLQKAIIEVRACFKSCPKDKVWTEEMGNENLSKLEWKSVDRPNTGSSKKVDEARYTDCFNMINTMTGNGMDRETIEPMVTEIYGEEIVKAIFKALTAE